MMLEGTTVVLGGGGVWGVAWMTGLLTGLAEAGLDLSAAPGFVGTSAGSVLSTQVCCGRSLRSLYDRQVLPELQPREHAPAMAPAASGGADATDLGKLGALLQDMDIDPAERSRRLGVIALAAATIPFADRRRDIAERLGLDDASWPEKDLAITAVDARSGELVTFNGSSGVDLIDAVAASCAVPGIWPPTPIGERVFIDGGVWKTPENAHLAKGAERVIIISPVGKMAMPKLLDQDIEMLRRGGSRVSLIAPDDRSVATGGTNLLDPATRKPGAEAGLAQGREACERLQAELDG